MIQEISFFLLNNLKVLNDVSHGLCRAEGDANANGGITSLGKN